MQRKKLSDAEIIEEYKKGRCDFSGIECKGADFSGMNLSGAIFKNSDLSFSSFKSANLTGCDFSLCVLDWCDFDWAALRKTSFEKASMRWVSLNDAILEKTSLRCADLSWSLAFNINLGEADIRGADISLVAFHLSECTPEGIALAQAELGKWKTISYDRWLLLRFVVNKLSDEFRKINIIPENAYNASVGYGSGSGNYQIASAENLTYTVERRYGISSRYRKEYKE